MARKVIFLVMVILFLSSASQVISAPTFLKVIPVSGTEIDLHWTAAAEEAYDIWSTADGINWSKIYTTEPGANSFTVTEDIHPYTNYYFLIAAAGAIGNPLTDADSGNSTEFGVGYPPNRHVHNYYLADTNLCANCHSTHRSSGPTLLNYPTVEDTCLTCHDGSQSKYNVLEGEVSRDGTWNNPLVSAAGPFGSLMGRTAGSEPVSIHSLGTPLNEAPGGNQEAMEEWEESLSCVSCHAAHFSTNFRILALSLPENSNIQVRAFADSNFDPEKETVNYIEGINDLCGGCHPDYHVEGGSGSEAAAGTYQSDGLFRHPVGVSPADYGAGLATTLPLEGMNRDNSDKITCLTCHQVHGSTTLAHPFKEGEESGEPTNYLLRKNYYGVCQDCHQK